MPVDDSRRSDSSRGRRQLTFLPLFAAADAGLSLIASRDLSPQQRLGRPRDRLIRAAQPVLRHIRDRSVWAGSLVGGDALQRCHRAGLLEYRLLRFTG